MIKSYLIGYDLNKSGQDYETLIAEIKKLGIWWHCLDSTWIVKSSSTAKNIRDHLKMFIDGNDEVLVVCLTGEGSWVGFSDECSNWLKNNL
ncbi:SinR family protein [Olivibacter oleidegradans]|uniref:SinR family protein n=1 Tax=Olivibacter oleidegradans TaxID=760123 RepID=A0ABV6HMV9_9SPHI